MPYQITGIDVHKKMWTTPTVRRQSHESLGTIRNGNDTRSEVTCSHSRLRHLDKYHRFFRACNKTPLGTRRVRPSGRLLNTGRLERDHLQTNALEWLLCWQEAL